MLAVILTWILPGPSTVILMDLGEFKTPNRIEVQMAAAGGPMVVGKDWVPQPTWCVVQGHPEMRDPEGELRPRPDHLVCNMYHYRVIERDEETIYRRGQRIEGIVVIHRSYAVNAKIIYWSVGPTWLTDHDIIP